MAKKFLTSLSLVSLASDPVSGTEGELYYNNVSDGVRLYKNGAWTDLSSTGALPSGGATGQILAKSSNTDYAVEWIENYADWTEIVKVKVKNDGTRALYKGQPVYVTGSDGTNVLVGRSSNVTEGVSSKTIGILAENLATNGIGYVVKEGKLGTLDTSAAGAVGDPVWLGVDGELIYGLANKPYAPAHLVYLGVVTKKNGSTGEIFIQVQNGFEIRELHDVGIGYSASIQNDQALVYNSSASVWSNADIVNSLYGTGNQIDVSSNNGDITLSLPNDLTAPGNLTVTGNLTVSGSTTYINTETLSIEDNIVLLNSNVTGSPTGTAGIEIERGTSPNAYVLWDESLQAWDFSDDIRTHAVRNQDIVEINVSASPGFSGEIDLLTAFAELNINTDGSIDLRPGDISGFEMYKFTKTYLQFPDLTQQNTAFLGMTSYDTNDLDEGTTNLYFTNERAIDALGSTLSDYLLTSSASTIYQPLDSDLTAIAAISGSSGFLTTDGSGSWSIDTNTYLVSETDPVFTASDAYGIMSIDISNWNESYFWGNHASAGYSLDTHNHTLDSLSNVDINSLNDGDSIVWSSASGAWVNEVITGGSGNIVTVSSTAPTSPNIGDGWYDNTDGTYHVYDGTYWVEVTSVITMSDEEAQDKVAPLFDHSNHVNITASYDDINNEIILTSSSTPDLSAYLTASVASSTYQPIGSYLTSESDTLETVTGRGASSTNAISITNTTVSTSPTTGALVVSGGVGIDGDLHVSNDIHIDGDINVTGSISGSLTYINVTDLVVTDPLIYLADSNPNDMVDIGIFGAYNHSASIKYHTGLIRDASDSGKWKLASNLLNPVSNIIDFSGSILDTLVVGNLESIDASFSGSVNIGSVVSGSWYGSEISYNHGGTGLTTIGTAGQVLTVNSGATGLEWADASGGSSFTNSSELAALISDETGSGSLVFSNSPTFTGTVSGITNSMVGLGNVENTALSTWAGSSNITTLGTVTSGTWNGSVIGDSYLNDALTISGGTVDNTPIGATTASTGRFTSVNINGVALTETSTGTTSATSTFNTTVYSAAEYIIYASTSAGNYVSKVMMLARGSATPIITEYAILTQGTAPSVTITPSYSAPNAVLTVAVTSGTNIEIIATEVSI